MSNPMQGNANAKSVLDWRNVTNYGADPTGTNDSTTAFSDFTTAVGADGVGVVPSGTYKLTSLPTFESTATYIFAPGAILLLNGVPQQRLSYYHPAGEPYNVLRETFASGSSTTTTGSMASGSTSLTGVASTTGWSIGMGISVAGAGASGALLVSQVMAISGSTFTLADSAGTAVTAATVSHDEGAAIRKAYSVCNSAGGGTILLPEGTYLVSGADPNDPDSASHIYLYDVNYVLLRGSSWQSVLKAGSTDLDLFRITGGSSNCGLQDIYLNRVSGAVSGGNGIHHYNWYANPQWVFRNVLIENQYDGENSDTARPQAERWVQCITENNVNCGHNLIMNNDVFFVSCSLSLNGLHGLVIGGSSTEPSDGSVYLSSCVIYKNTEDGIHAVGTSAEVAGNIFVDGGIVDSNGNNGVTLGYCTGVRINTHVSFSNAAGIYIGTGAQEVDLGTSQVSDNDNDGIYITGEATLVHGSPSSLSNGRSSAYSGYGVRIDNGATYVNMPGVFAGNAPNVNGITRNTQSGGAYIDSTQSGGAPDYLSLIGWHFPGMGSDTFVFNGTQADNIVTVDVQGPAFAVAAGQYIGFAGAGGAQRLQYNGATGAINADWQVAALDGAGDGISSSAQTLATGDTITTAQTGGARTTNTAAVTGIILGAGSYGGQRVTVFNEGTGSITFAASSSNVQGGSSVSIAASSATMFVWESVQGLWYPV